MKRIPILTAVVATLLFAAQAEAQRGGFMQLLSGGGAQLDSAILAMEEVQKELEFTEEQVEKIGKQAAELNDELRSEMREIMMSGGDMSELQDLLKELREEEKEFIALLNDDQQERLSQLRYQRMGDGIYQNEDVQKELGMTKDQVTSIKDAFEEGQEAMRNAMEDARDSGDFGSIRETMSDLQKELTDSLNEILSDEQKEKVEAMKGEAFEFPQPRRRGRQRSDF